MIVKKNHQKKKLVSLLYLVTFICFMFSCSSNNDPDISEIEEDYKFSLEKAVHSINWIAYKTTDKVPVSGSFKTLKITSKGQGNSIRESLNNCAFEIPVSSLESNDATRNHNLINYFFLKMIASKTLTGSININSDSAGTMTLKMNDRTNEVPFTYTITNTTANITAQINMSNWNLTKALEALNTKCRLLHMGGDGIVKVWDEVSISIQLKF